MSTSPTPKQQRRWPTRAGIGAALIMALAGCGTAASVSTHSTTTQPTQPQTAAAAPATTAPAPAVPSPNGTGSGSCDYTLGDNPAGGTAVATGEVDLTNTGNVGAVVKVTIAWPQEGYSPITATQTVKMPFGANGLPVRFHEPLTSTQLDNLQSYELSHSSASSYCTYDETILSTYGAAH